MISKVVSAAAVAALIIAAAPASAMKDGVLQSKEHG